MATETKENYLKAMRSISQFQKDVTITALAKKMEVSKPTANNMVKKMQEIGWVKYEKYKPLTLTLKGNKTASLIVRKHRLAEMFLVQNMGFNKDEVHDIAEQLEHIHSPKFFDRMDEILKTPKYDPHGSPIPDKDGVLPPEVEVKLSTLKVGEKGIINGFLKQNKAFDLLMAQHEIKLGKSFELTGIEPFDYSFSLCFNGEDIKVLSLEACESIWVILVDQ
ncbi:metal-dependent transcriptional regulator [Crocinitomix catalasitica]|uniref:metal-dependent transcriptional regulator n=1 Tax=Crocinitomix catalasitica TaxID=184607 RepID=UPI00048700B7|nr:metal-dependent transcriptional regulator [Crocinitomix catalasitica]